MKRIREYLPFVSKSIKTADFKTFCAGGSPEYISTRKIVAKSGLKHVEGNAKLRSMTAYSISPLAFFDAHFFLIGAAVALVAILEKTFAQSGMLAVAEVISIVLQIAFPVIVFGSMVLLIAHSSFLL